MSVLTIDFDNNSFAAVPIYGVSVGMNKNGNCIEKFIRIFDL